MTDDQPKRERTCRKGFPNFPESFVFLAIAVSEKSVTKNFLKEETSLTSFDLSRSSEVKSKGGKWKPTYDFLLAANTNYMSKVSR